MTIRELIADHRFQAGAVFVVALLRFVNLGYVDLQPWDESLYAVRAETIVQYGDWLDQTPHSIGGTYSSTHPPLYVWLTSIAYRTFGINEFSARFFSALFGAGTIILVYFFGRRFFGSRTGFIAAMFLGLNPFYTFWTRQGQFDATLVFFLTLAAFLYLLSLESSKPWPFYLGTGVALGLGLLTKLFVCLIFPVVALATMLAFDRPRWPRHFQAVIVSTAVALAIALPWHVMMTLRHGLGNPLYYFAVSQLTERTFVGIEGNVKALGPLYFPNRLVVALPYAVFFFLHRSWKLFKESNSIAEPFLFLWFCLYAIAITVMRTKLAVYSLPLFIPVVLLAARSVESTMKGEVPRRVHLILLGLTAVALGWATKLEWRTAAKAALAAFLQLRLPPTADLYTAAVFILLSIFLALVLYEIEKGERTHRWVTDRLLPLILIPLSLIFLASVVILDTMRYDDGAKELAALVNDRSYTELYVVGAEQNPQLTFYLNGADIGWDPGRFAKRLPLKGGVDRIRTFLERRISQPGQFFVVVERYELRAQGMLGYGRLLPSGFELSFESSGYFLFQKQEFFARID